MTDIPLNPSPLSLWVWAIRPRTLPLSASAIVLGFGLAVMEGATRWAVFILALLTALLLQILSNLANDYGDAVAGKDTADRVGPPRMVGSGLTTPQRMFRAMILASSLAFLAGLALVLVASWNNWPRLLFFLVLGASCVAAAILYTVGKHPYGYLGLGDFMAGFFFGPVAVWGSAVLCGAETHLFLILPGVAAGLCSTMVLNVNNIRDIETDRRTGKMTVAARLGLERARLYHAALAGLTVLSWASFWLLHYPTFLPGLVFVIPLLHSVCLAVSRPHDAANLNRQLRNTVLGSAVCNTGMALLCMAATAG